MKHRLMALTVASALVTTGYQLVAHAAQQGAMADRAAVEKALMTNEARLNEAFAKRDVATMKSMIADDGWSVDMAGGAPVSEMFKQLPTMDIKIAEQSTSNFRYTWADANTVVVSYTWTGKGTYMGQPVPSPTYASSVWTKRGAKWVAVFHQETAAMTPPKK